MKKYIVHFVSFLGMALVFGACKDKNPYPIPDYTVSFTIDLNAFDMDFAIGEMKTFGSGRSGSFGYMGVVVYRAGIDEFYAFDMACPNDHYSGCAVAQDNEFATAPPSDLCLHCSNCCHCRFSLLDGYPQNNSSDCKYPLKQYRVTKRTDFQFVVHN